MRPVDTSSASGTAAGSTTRRRPRASIPSAVTEFAAALTAALATICGRSRARYRWRAVPRDCQRTGAHPRRYQHAAAIHFAELPTILGPALGGLRGALTAADIQSVDYIARSYEKHGRGLDGSDEKRRQGRRQRAAYQWRRHPQSVPPIVGASVPSIVGGTLEGRSLAARGCRRCIAALVCRSPSTASSSWACASCQPGPIFLPGLSSRLVRRVQLP